MINKIVDDVNINIAVTYLQSKKDTVGIDGIKVSKLDEYLLLNKQQLKLSILNETYCPKPVIIKDILKKNQKKRQIAKLSSIDKLVNRMVYQVIEDLVTPLFSINSFAYQKNKGIKNAVFKVCQYLDEGNEYVLAIDIRDFFPSINHDILLNIVKRYIRDNKTVELIKKLIKPDILINNELVYLMAYFKE